MIKFLFRLIAFLLAGHSAGRAAAGCVVLHLLHLLGKKVPAPQTAPEPDIQDRPYL
jgi:hypothetical protein